MKKKRKINKKPNKKTTTSKTTQPTTSRPITGVTSIGLVIHGRKVRLTIEEAKTLQTSLNNLFPLPADKAPGLFPWYPSPNPAPNPAPLEGPWTVGDGTSDPLRQWYCDHQGTSNPGILKFGSISKSTISKPTCKTPEKPYKKKLIKSS